MSIRPLALKNLEAPAASKLPLPVHDLRLDTAKAPQTADW